VVIDVVMCSSGGCEGEKKPRHVVRHTCQSWWRLGSLEQIEFLSPADRCPTVVHPELGVNVFGVGTHGVQGHDEFAGNFRAVQVGSEQPKHFKLTFAQWLDQNLFDGRSV
jgi:hypothetical protein